MRSVLISVLFLIVFSFTAEAQTATVTSRKVTYKRPSAKVEHKKSFTINYPTIKGISPAIARRAERNLGYEKLFGFTIREELGDLQWLEEADYEVLHNKKGLLCVQLFITGSAAYPSGSTKNVVVDLKTGNRISAPDVFTDLSVLAGLVRKAQQREVQEAITAIKKDPENNDLDTKELFSRTRFGVKDLDGFSIDDKGVTFVYEYGFPHVIQALQPNGQFQFSWDSLKPYIKRAGAFAQFVR
jgi:hypothetical protein